MTLDQRSLRLGRILSWTFTKNHPLYEVLEGGLTVGLRDYPEITLDDCQAFAFYVKGVSERYGFDPPAQGTVARWLSNLGDHDELMAAYAAHEFAENRYPTALRQWQHRFCDDRKVARELSSSMYLGNLFHLIWHIITDDGQLERWDGRIPWADVG
ncbi:MAG: hypothetical protein NUV56_02380 [Candidatus Uhrbacteria bacterium]|nr:hypothetical protein [Candidatus Uhrbacteria bacterium]